MTLVDTNVLSELGKPLPAVRVVEFIANLDQLETFASVISIGELAFGIAKLPTGRRNRDLSQWLGALQVRFSDRILSPDVETAHLWGELAARLAQSGRTIPLADCWIAATALRHGLTLATRNTRDFQHTGVSLVNPWEA